ISRSSNASYGGRFCAVPQLALAVWDNQKNALPVSLRLVPKVTSRWILGLDPSEAVPARALVAVHGARAIAHFTNESETELSLFMVFPTMNYFEIRQRKPDRNLRRSRR